MLRASVQAKVAAAQAYDSAAKGAQQAGEYTQARSLTLLYCCPRHSTYCGIPDLAYTGRAWCAA